MGQKAHSALEEARLATANAIGCERSELYFTSGGSEADNWAIKGTAELMAKKVKAYYKHNRRASRRTAHIKKARKARL